MLTLELRKLDDIKTTSLMMMNLKRRGNFVTLHDGSSFHQQPTARNSSSSYPSSPYPIRSSRHLSSHLFCATISDSGMGRASSTWAIDETLCMCWEAIQQLRWTHRLICRTSRGWGREREMCGERRRQWLKWNTKSTVCSKSLQLHQA